VRVGHQEPSGPWNTGHNRPKAATATHGSSSPCAACWTPSTGTRS